ncbi:General transcription factor IIH subunit 3 [Araneus ventricosus]|uniref:General transcription factor IIH subunit 3 n=1 Tax=Araneus ventricosus TaxID=182803 RepID=A0A4Y2I3C0_ARAVE|nr:General transcription factor IIH subunit 3 [Araneus ventricosus]
MQDLAGNRVGDEVLRSLWLQRLPTQTQDLNKLSIMADKIADGTSGSEICSTHVKTKPIDRFSRWLEACHHVTSEETVAQARKWLDFRFGVPQRSPPRETCGVLSDRSCCGMIELHYPGKLGRSGPVGFGCDISGGMYLKIQNVSTLLQYLLWIFLPNVETRKKMILPTRVYVDYRAACFCHRNLIEIGYVCSVCLSIFCTFSPILSTCQTAFKLGPLLTIIAKKRKKQAPLGQ